MVIFKRDQYVFGVILGLVMPMLSFFGYYYWKFSLFSFARFLSALQTNTQLITSLSIPCLFLNIVLFTLFINGQKDKTAKGIFTVSVTYALAAFLFKLLA